MTDTKLKNKRAERTRKGLYIESEIANEVQALAERSGLSFNAAASQLIELGLHAVKNKEVFSQ